MDGSAQEQGQAGRNPPHLFLRGVRPFDRAARRFSKRVKEDLSNADRKELRKALDILKQELKAAEQMTERGKGLVESLGQATAYLRGERTLAAATYNVPDHVDVRAVRQKIGLSQQEFAAKYALSARTVQ